VQVLKQVPVFKKIEEQYERTIVLPQIEQEKRILSEIREVSHRRYDSVEIKKHINEYQMKKKQIEMESRKKRSDTTSQSFQAPKTKFTYAIEDELEQQKELREMKQKQPQQSRQKILNYVTYVKEFHMPKASENKSHELQQMKEKIKTQPRQVST